MNRHKYHQSVTTILLASTLALSLSSAPILVLAQQSNSVRVGLPGRRVGGGTRGACSFGKQQLTALTPKNNLALTIAANPQLFFYFPQTDDARLVEFVLLDEAENEIYVKTFKTTGKAGIVSFNLLDSAPLKALPIGKKYHWYLSIICNDRDRADDVAVDGWIQRVQLDSSLAQKIAKVAPSQRSAMYAAANIWQEALTELAQLRSSHPQDPTVTAEWKELLRSQELDFISQAPAIENQ